MFENFQQPNKQQNLDEKFLIVIGDLKNYSQFYVLVPGRKQFATLLNLLSPENYIVSQVHILTSIKDYDKFVKELKEESTPDGLNFG